MKRSFLYTALVFTTVVIATGSMTFGDSKNRMGSGGFNRGQGDNNGGQNAGSLRGRLGNLNGSTWNGKGHGNSGNGGSGNGQPGGINISGGSHQQQHGIKLPNHGNNANILSQIGRNGHSVLLPNGTKTKTSH